MTQYVLITYSYYGGHEIIGVFSSMEKAVKEWDRLVAAKSDISTEYATHAIEGPFETDEGYDD